MAFTDTDAIVTFADTGPGVAHPDILFDPCRPEADGSGLGLYRSRELARSFGRELRHDPSYHGGQFSVLLLLAHRLQAEAACV